MTKKMLPRRPIKMDESPRVRERMIRQEEDLTMVKPTERQAGAPMKDAKMEDDSIAEDWIISGAPIPKTTQKEEASADVQLNVPAKEETPTDPPALPPIPETEKIRADEEKEMPDQEDPTSEKEEDPDTAQPRDNLATAAMKAVQVDGILNKIKNLWAEAKKQTEQIKQRKQKSKQDPGSTTDDHAGKPTEDATPSEAPIGGTEKGSSDEFYDAPVVSEKQPENDPEIEVSPEKEGVPTPARNNSADARDGAHDYDADAGTHNDARDNARDNADARDTTPAPDKNARAFKDKRARTREDGPGLFVGLGNKMKKKKGKKESEDPDKPKKSAAERAREKAVQDYQQILDGKINPDSFKGKLIRKRMRAEGYVYLYTLDYVLESDRYILRLDMVKKPDLPQDAHHMTGQEGHYGYDVNGVVFDSQRENGFTQISAYNYMHNHKIEDAFSYKWMSKREGGNKKFLILIVGIGIAAAVYVFYVFMH